MYELKRIDFSKIGRKVRGVLYHLEIVLRGDSYYDEDGYFEVNGEKGIVSYSKVKMKYIYSIYKEESDCDILNNVVFKQRNKKD